MVPQEWNSENGGSSPLEWWQAKIRRLHRHLRGWEKHTSGVNKQEKDLLDKLDVLDKKAETNPLSQLELEAKHGMKESLARLLMEEEIKWYQRSKTKRLLQRDAKTQYFHLVANGKHRKTRIFQLQDSGRTITGEADLKKYITKYYRGETTFRLDAAKTADILQVSA
jgi:hypothetical protein